LFLQLINIYLIKLLEGYEEPIKSWPGLKEKQEAAFDALDGRLQELWNKIKAGQYLSEDEEIEFEQKSIEFHKTFPAKRSLLLSTKFGNAIRAFEQYGNEIYGADSVTLWSHLSAVVPKDFASAIGDAKAQVDSLVNLLYFSTFFAGVALSRAVYSCVGLLVYYNANRALNGLALQTVLFLVAAIAGAGAYALSIRMVYVWGEICHGGVRLLLARAREETRLSHACNSRKAKGAVGPNFSEGRLPSSLRARAVDAGGTR
jgi:hypothetical protein